MEKEKGGGAVEQSCWRKGGEAGLAQACSRVPLPVCDTPVPLAGTWGSTRASSQSKIDFISCDVRAAASGLPVRSQRGNAAFMLVRCDLFAISIKAVSDAEGRSFYQLRNSLVYASRFDVCHHPASVMLLVIKHLYL